MSQIDELRLMARVARMYYEKDMRQSEIAKQLGLSQATISRLFNRAKEEGIVRISVNVPQGVFSDLEEQIVDKFNLQDAIIVDCMNDDEQIIQRDVGAAAAYYVETTIKPGEIIGISSWSATLLAMVDAMHQTPRKADVRVVQILGGVGNPTAEIHATRLTSRFARLVNGTATFLPAPGIVGSEGALKVLLEDQYVKEAVDLFDKVSLALLGIGAVEPSKLLADSGNIYSLETLDALRSMGAVGDVLVRFFDAQGQSVQNSLDNRVVSMTLPQLRRVPRSVGVAGGKRKFKAILGALRGGFINLIITDRFTAERLMDSKL